jgi:leucyl aminopeptidase
MRFSASLATGVCFDTGGLNIKTVNMGNMKKDMSGAAQALALGSMIMEVRNETANQPSV